MYDKKVGPAKEEEKEKGRRKENSVASFLTERPSQRSSNRSNLFA
jgi:hypothetical protein